MKTDKKEILRELLLSENRGYIIGIKLKGVDEPIKTVVKSVEHNRIILESTCVYGDPLQRTIITLLEIEWVKRYRAVFSSPVLESIRIIRSNLQAMKAEMKLS
jgi:hypothetical protein